MNLHSISTFEDLNSYSAWKILCIKNDYTLIEGIMYKPWKNIKNSGGIFNELIPNSFAFYYISKKSQYRPQERLLQQLRSALNLLDPSNSPSNPQYIKSAWPFLWKVGHFEGVNSWKCPTFYLWKVGHFEDVNSWKCRNITTMGCIFFVFWFFVKNEKYWVIYRKKWKKNKEIFNLKNGVFFWFSCKFSVMMVSICT